MYLPCEFDFKIEGGSQQQKVYLKKAGMVLLGGHNAYFTPDEKFWGVEHRGSGMGAGVGEDQKPARAGRHAAENLPRPCYVGGEE
jgi:hypothetical protein